MCSAMLNFNCVFCTGTSLLLMQEKLLDRLEEVTGLAERISYIPEDIASVAVRIELKWLEQKELMRQEFASFLDMMASRQEELLARMENEVHESLEYLKSLKEQCEDVVSGSCQLSDDCITAVQNMPRNVFIMNYQQYLDSCQALEEKICSMPHPVDLLPTFLKVPFSLHQEKVIISTCLQFESFECLEMKAKQHQQYIPCTQLRRPMKLKKFIIAPPFPPSSSLAYKVQIFKNSNIRKQNLIWQSQRLLKANDFIFNTDTTPHLANNMLYMLGVIPVLCINNHRGKQTVEGRIFNIAILTDEKESPAIPHSASVRASSNKNVNNSSYSDFGDDSVAVITRQSIHIFNSHPSQIIPSFPANFPAKFSYYTVNQVLNNQGNTDQFGKKKTGSGKKKKTDTVNKKKEQKIDKVQVAYFGSCEY